MKPALPSAKSQSHSPSKSKKNSKDRDKKKSQNHGENAVEKGSPTMDGTNRKYSVITPEILAFYANQSLCEDLTEEVCSGFMEDINYKLRLLIHEAQIKAKLVSRNNITSSDIDEVFDCLQLTKSYGVPENPSFIPLLEQNLLYLDDNVVNLIELAEQDASYVQTGSVTLTHKLLSNNQDVSNPLKTYFVNVCQAAVSNDPKLRTVALNDVQQNVKIGPVIEWLYNFGYVLLSKDITYGCLTLRALNLIEALEYNPVSGFHVSEKQLKLSMRLLLQRLLCPDNTQEILRPICRTVALLCYRIPVRLLFVSKLIIKFYENVELNALPVLCASNEVGLDAILPLILTNLGYFLSLAKDNVDGDVAYELLRTYNILCSNGANSNELCDEFFEVYGEGIIPIWKGHPNECQSNDSLELNWLNVKSQLLKTRRKVLRETTSGRQVPLEEVFSLEENNGKRFSAETTTLQETLQTQTHITIGKMHLLAPVHKVFSSRYLHNHRKCTTHGLMFHNL